MPKESIGNYNSPFAQNLRDLMDGKVTFAGFGYNVQINELAEAIGATRQAVSQYRNGTVAPNTEKLCKIADYFNVSTDYLLGRTSFPKGGGADMTTVEKTTGLTQKAISNLRNFAMNSPEQFDTAPWSKFPYAKATDYSVIADKLIGSERFIDLVACISTYLEERKNLTREYIENRQKIFAKANDILSDESIDNNTREVMTTLKDYSIKTVSIFPDYWEYRIQELVKTIYKGMDGGASK